MPVLSLADISFQINAPDWLLIDSLEDFINAAAQGAVNIDVVFDDGPAVDKSRLLISTPEQSFYQTIDGTAVEFHHPDDLLTLAAVDREWKKCQLFLKKKYSESKDSTLVQMVQERLLSAFMEIFTAVLAMHKGLHIHSAAIDWQGRGLVFAAPSGVGKTTHAHLWQDLYDVIVLDGDASACRLIEGQPHVFGLPWCGTSQEYVNSSAPLQAMIFLEQAEENSIIKLDRAEAVMRMISGSFLPYWSKHLMVQVIDTAEELSNLVGCYLLQCRPDDQAVELVRRCIEKPTTK